MSPANHIRPKYDLHGLREKRIGGKHHAEYDLPLTSMVDMFSILVVFLLMNFSTSGEVFFISSHEVKIPNAIHGRPLESAPVVSISNEGVSLDEQKMNEDKLHLADTEEGYPQMRAKLQQMRIIEQTARPDVPFKGQVNIRADQNIPLEQIKKVMMAIISEGWTGINFAVVPAGAVPIDEDAPNTRGTASEK